jgi:hypothetical protein
MEMGCGRDDGCGCGCACACGCDCGFVGVVVLVLAVCRCSYGVVVTDVVCLLCLWSWCGGGYDQGYLASELLPSLRLADLLQSTWIVNGDGLWA